MNMGRSMVIFLDLLLAAAAAGCRAKTREGSTTEIPPVPVSHPIQRVVTDYVDFTGRTDAVQSVNIVARVTGYLEPPLFKEGSEVKAGDLLFVIDPRPYKAQLDQAKSQVKLTEEELNLAKSTLARYQDLDKTTPGAVSKQALDQYKAAVAEAEARRDAQTKSLEVYNLNKEFTEVTSPIDGQVSRYYLTRGNLVNQDQTLLTTVVSLDPIYAYFDMDERTLLQIRKAVSEGKITRPASGDLPVLLGLENEDGFPHKGTIDFVNNQVNSTTGSITMRGVFDNPRLMPDAKAPSAAAPQASSPAKTSASTAPSPEKIPTPKASSSGKASASKGSSPAKASAPKASPPGKTPASKASSPGKTSPPDALDTRRYVPRLFSPGMFVRIRLPIGQPHPALLIIDRAIQSDQGLKYVYVLDAKNRAQSRSIKTGPLQEDGLRVVEGDIKPDDWVVVGGIQQVRAQGEVKPDPRTMPSLGGPPEAAPPTAARAKPGPAAAGKPKD